MHAFKFLYNLWEILTYTLRVIIENVQKKLLCTVYFVPLRVY